MLEKLQKHFFVRTYISGFINFFIYGSNFDRPLLELVLVNYFPNTGTSDPVARFGTFHSSNTTQQKPDRLVRHLGSNLG